LTIEETPISADRLKLFISYSRRDMASADALVSALEGDGFEITIDRCDLPYGEEWQKELADFIRGSDTVLWLVSPDSVSSKWCNWELGEVGRLNKRLVPVRSAMSRLMSCRRTWAGSIFCRLMASTTSGGATRAALLATRAHRGTGSSNPLPSSKQSVSRLTMVEVDPNDPILPPAGHHKSSEATEDQKREVPRPELAVGAHMKR
jgi:hypothetical protein